MKKIIIFASLLGLFATAWAASVNPDYWYFVRGETPGYRQWVLVDPGNWWMPLAGNEGVSGTGKLTMTASDDKNLPGAINLKWKKQEGWAAVFVAGGSQVDLSAFEHSAQLLLALKVKTPPKQSVTVKMKCGEGCEGGIDIKDSLRNVKKDTWFALPIALDCFVQQGVDLSKIMIPFEIGTAGRLELEIAEIGIRPLDEGYEGCKANPAPGGQGESQ